MKGYLDMHLDQLRTYLAVVENKSFSKAAEALYISHSTTSRTIASLEASLGVRLLYRDNRSVRLTQAGELLYREGVKLMRKVDSIESAVRNAGMGHTGRVSVSTVNLYSYELYGAYKDFCKRYPGVMLGMYPNYIQDVHQQVSSGDADVGVTFSYALPEDITELDIRKIASERFCVVAPVEHPLAMQKSVTLEDLKSSSYIALPQSGLDFERRMEDLSGTSMSRRESNVVPTIESLFLQIRSGNGVSLVPYPLANEYGTNCAILELADTDTSFDVVLIWRRDNLNPSLPLLLDAMLSRIKAQTPDSYNLS